MLINPTILKKVFICGIGRSGSTILKLALLQHDRFFGFQDEIRFLTDPGGLLGLNSTLLNCKDPWHIDKHCREFIQLCSSVKNKTVFHDSVRVVSRIFKINSLRYSNIGLSKNLNGNLIDCADSYLRNLGVQRQVGGWTGTDFGTRRLLYTSDHVSVETCTRANEKFFQQLSAMFIKKLGADFFVDDTPFNGLWANELLKAFPGSKFIFIDRDPRDILASYAKVYFGLNGVKANYSYVKKLVEANSEVRCRLPRTQFISLNLEDLVASPNKELSRISDFLKVSDFTDKYDGFFDAHNIGRWRKELDPKYH